MTLILIATCLLVAGLVKGIFGMGLPTVSLGLLSLWMAPVEAAALIIVPTLATNAWQFLAGPRRIALLRRLATLLFGLVLGTAMGIGFLTGADAALVSLVLGGVLLLYAAVGLHATHWRISSHHERWISPFAGCVTGVVNGATGVSVIPLVPYLNSIGMQRDDLVQAMGCCFLVAMLALAGGLAWSGHLTLGSARASLLALIPVFIGMAAGGAIRAHLPAQQFRRWFFVGLIVLGGYTAIRAGIQFL